MQSVEYCFDAFPKRSGHACCFIPPFTASPPVEEGEGECSPVPPRAQSTKKNLKDFGNCLVQFGGWPPSREVKQVIRKEGARCPLFMLSLEEVGRAVDRVGKASRPAPQPHPERLLLSKPPLKDKQPKKVHHETEVAYPPTLEERIEQMKRVQRLIKSFQRAERRPHSRASLSTSSSERGLTRSGYPPEDWGRGEEEEDGYHSGSSGEEEGEEEESSEEDSESNSSSPTPAVEGGSMRVEPVTVERLRRMQNEMDPVAPSARSAASTRTGTHLLSSSVSVQLAQQYHALDTAAAPFPSSPQPPRAPEGPRLTLQWGKVVPPIAPKTRHGHSLVYCYPNVYLIGGCYWAHGDAMSTVDLYYHLPQQVWRQCSESAAPSRFMASLALSNASHTLSGNAKTDKNDPHLPHIVFYQFGGLDFTRNLTNTLYRCYLPECKYMALTQLGHLPRPQFKGVLVCDVQVELDPFTNEGTTVTGEGNLYYMDGFQEGKPMVPCVRQYNLQQGMWRRVCTSPDLVRSQLSYVSYETITRRLADNSEKETTRLLRFDVLGGMPSRRGRQYRSRRSHSFSVTDQCFDYSWNDTGLRGGLTAHTVVLLPVPGHHPHSPFALPSSALVAASSVWWQRSRLLAVCCGGNQDLLTESKDGGMEVAEQNSLGEPVGYFYLLRERPLSLSEIIKVFTTKHNVPYKLALSKEKDALLDELF